VTKDEFIVSDRDNHASINAANMMAKGGFAQYKRYIHNDTDDLERVLKSIPLEATKLVATDGVFSTTGEIVDLPRLVNLCKKYNARLMVDDAHSTGVIGVGGRGTASEFNLTDSVDLIMGTFSKTFSSLGGFVGSEKPVINYLKHHASALIFSASPTPAAVAAAEAALEILKAEPERVDRLITNAKKMRDGFRSLGFRILEGKTPIVPVILGDDMLAFQFWRKLYDKGIFVNAFVSPGVPPTMAMLRTSYMATHEDKHLDKILEVFSEIGKEMGIIN
jgi:8-amino-7-oxononanoate synthase